MQTRDACKQYTYDTLAVGQTASFPFTIDQATIDNFAALSGDKSPLHVDAEYAEATEFGRPLAHGMIAGMLFSRLVGMELPGKYAVYLSQQIKFRQPAFVGDRIMVTGTIVAKHDAFQTIHIRTEVSRELSGELLTSGEAIVRVLK